MIINKVSGDAVVDICLDTAKLGKQSIVFVSTKKGAEACAERVAMKLSLDEKAGLLAQEVERVLSSPTKQCLRLGKVLRRGVAFHHSGLSSVQRRIIEDGFRAGSIRFICSTTTLGAGLDLPAFRSVIRDLKRFSPGWGQVPIPVLEYEQMAGRAGRPSFDLFGEAICVASSSDEKDFFLDEYVNGSPEDISSKLAVEPILRMYVLSLISSGYASSFRELMDFLSLTLYAHQYKDLGRLESIILSVITSLEDFGFVVCSNKKSSFFQSANNLVSFGIEATRLGRRVSELYLDPLTAYDLIEGLKNAKEKVSAFSVLQLICSVNEMRPLMSIRKKDEELVNGLLLEHDLLTLEESSFSDYFYEFAGSVKTAHVLCEWMDERHEDFLFDEYNVTPGELNSKIERANWVLYSCMELAKIVPEIKREFLDLHIVRERLIKGIREELLPLVKFKGVGRVRARKLFNNRVRDVGDVKKVDINTLVDLIGESLAFSLKKQVGQDLSKEKVVVKKNKRKGQFNLNDFDGK
ncbi:MAG: helicase-related protein [Candidatus Woesearchaeota archaeon]